MLILKKIVFLADGYFLCTSLGTDCFGWSSTIVLITTGILHSWGVTAYICIFFPCLLLVQLPPTLNSGLTDLYKTAEGLRAHGCCGLALQRTGNGWSWLNLCHPEWTSFISQCFALNKTLIKKNTPSNCRTCSLNVA